ncbi:S8 family serine peptidase [Bradyrhizobium sp. SZCCHNS2002]|uniref:S8 family serine peptidase n=1 Tax=Bradyrhizobium sp. SZCCHNS2002 TaxID=3057302 RepID=UPI00291643E9|nr:S8 family serine peptidase [Bradyrhizobium sp. SZCCHNS2002]
MIRQLIVMQSEGAGDISDGPRLPTGGLTAIEARLRALLAEDDAGRWRVLSVPDESWRVRLTQRLPEPPPPLNELVVSIECTDSADVELFRRAVDHANARAREQDKTKPFKAVGADIALSQSEFFCPTNPDQLLFGDRDTARRLTGADALGEQGLTGRGVNVVVIDQGFDARLVKNFGGGLANGDVEPGSTRRGHGPMMVRNIADAAPDAMFYDVPLLPARIGDVTGFISTALHVFYLLDALIAYLRQLPVPQWKGPWVLVNAWSIFDRSSEHPRGDYTERRDHPLNAIVGTIGAAADIVFAAGNCGQFCPDRRCGKADVGPGSSIFGANSHPDVLTVGAVRTDARWAGRSSQGPGQPQLSRHKPDLCAPSYFREVGADAFAGNVDGAFLSNDGPPYLASTGTSAACGLAAGIVAAIRSGCDQTSVSPGQLRQLLNDHARKVEGPSWNGQLGHGIINVEDALAALSDTSA